jgi:hypothetical protein
MKKIKEGCVASRNPKEKPRYLSPSFDNFWNLTFFSQAPWDSKKNALYASLASSYFPRFYPSQLKIP